MLRTGLKKAGAIFANKAGPQKTKRIKSGGTKRTNRHTDENEIKNPQCGKVAGLVYGRRLPQDVSQQGSNYTPHDGACQTPQQGVPNPSAMDGADNFAGPGLGMGC